MPAGSAAWHDLRSAGLLRALKYFFPVLGAIMQAVTVRVDAGLLRMVFTYAHLAAQDQLRYSENMAVPIDEKWLFIKTCQDLAKKSQSPELYDKLRMAGLLAQLLIGVRSLARMVAGNQEMIFLVS